MRNLLLLWWHHADLLGHMGSVTASIDARSGQGIVIGKGIPR